MTVSIRRPTITAMVDALRLCGFADEISPDVAEQAAACRRLGLTHVELRSVDGVNVLDFDADRRDRVRRTLADAGLGVACIGSPVGKVPVDRPWAEHFDRFKVAVDAADYFGAGMVRVFSYYPPSGGGTIADHRDEVVRRFRAKVDHIAGTGLTLVHENERNIFGERGVDCLHLLEAVGSPRLRAAFDFANFVQAGDDPVKCWELLGEYVAHIHVKDATADGTVVVPGRGVGRLGDILAAAYAGGYRGFLSLEPHLAAAGPFSGFSGPDLFAAAVAGLRAVCADARVPVV